MWRRALALAFGLFLFPGLAFAEPWTPGPFAQGDSSIIGFIDYPTADATVKQGDKLALLGWVVDNTAGGWTGIDEVHVYRGTSADQFLGRATYGGERPDVADFFHNASWKNSGFNFTVDTSSLALGSYTLTVYAHTPAKGWWSRSVAVKVVRGAASADTTAETMSWKTPQGHSITTVSTLVNALTQLARSTWGAWALDIPADGGLQILWSSDLGNRFSVYQYGSRVILVNAAHSEADPRAVAAAIAHELQHAVDDALGWSSWRAVTCVDLESRAFLAQAWVWSSFYGPFGKVQPVDPLEEAHNAVLSAVTARPATWSSDAASKYRSPCS
ncbi:MAG: hypothetical protein HY690_04535 [Chloroflexi bacterium]|nr:hypothetical protein [Chloroflexota bacterium]